MSSSKKKGITLASLVVYVVLFAIFTVFVANVSSSTTEKLFDNRGEAINYSGLNKLQYNIENSAANSNTVFTTPNSISYSNGDNYVYNSGQQVIYKNGGILCTNVTTFTVSSQSSSHQKKVVINVTFNKYLNNLTRSIICCVEEF